MTETVKSGNMAISSSVMWKQAPSNSVLSTPQMPASLVVLHMPLNICSMASKPDCEMRRSLVPESMTTVLPRPCTDWPLMVMPSKFME